MTGSEWVATIAVGLVILVGIAGTVLPILPGLFLVWGAVVVYGLVVGFGLAGWLAVILTTGLLVLGLYLNVRIPQKSAADAGLTVGAQLFGLALAVAGFFVVPVVGFPLGFVLGVFVVRYHRTGNAADAWASTRRTVVAIIRASAAQAACAVGMFVVWVGWAMSVVIA